MEKPRMKKLYEGKAKILYETEEPNTILMEFKDSLTAFDGTKKDTREGKGSINCQISTYLFQYLEQNGIATHFLKTLSKNQMLCKVTEIIPLEVVVRNIAAGSFSKRYGIAEGTTLEKPIVEFFLKDDALHDPLIPEQDAIVLKYTTNEELEFLKIQALTINELLKTFFDRLNIIVVDFKLEFGRTKDGEIILADEITPDTMRLWDKETKQKLDKDVFRRDLGEVMTGYRELLSRINDNWERFQNAPPIKLKSTIEIKIIPKKEVFDTVGELTKVFLQNNGYEDLLTTKSGKILKITFNRPLTSNLLRKLRKTIEEKLTKLTYSHTLKCIYRFS